MRKVFNTISTGAIILALLLLFGAAGASDQGTYTTTQVLTQVGASAALLFGGLLTKVIVNK